MPVDMAANAVRLNIHPRQSPAYTRALACLSSVKCRKARVYVGLDRGRVSLMATEMLSAAERRYMGHVPTIDDESFRYAFGALGCAYTQTGVSSARHYASIIRYPPVVLLAEASPAALQGGLLVALGEKPHPQDFGDGKPHPSPIFWRWFRRASVWDPRVVVVTVPARSCTSEEATAEMAAWVGDLVRASWSVTRAYLPELGRAVSLGPPPLRVLAVCDPGVPNAFFDAVRADQVAPFVRVGP